MKVSLGMNRCLVAYRSNLSWSFLGSNENATLSEALIEDFIIAELEQLSSNKSLPCSETLIERYHDRWELEKADVQINHYLGVRH